MENKLPKRKSLRLKDYDYSKEGFYFVTLCTKNRKKILSHIVGVDAHIDPLETKVLLTYTGNVINDYILNYNLKFDNVRIHEYVIMPNHVHLIIELCKRVDECIDPYTISNRKNTENINNKKFADILYGKEIIMSMLLGMKKII